MHNLVLELFAGQGVPLAVLGAVIVLLWFGFYVLSALRAHEDGQFAVAAGAISLMWSYEFLFVFVWPVDAPLWYVEIAWLMLDTVLLMQVFRYGPVSYPHAFLRDHALRVTLATWIGAFALLAAYVFYYDLVTGDVVAYGVDMVLAMLMVGMLFHRPDGVGLSLPGNLARAAADALVAVTVWTNYTWTLRHAQDPGTTGDNNPLSLVLFAVTSLCDVVLVAGLIRARRRSTAPSGSTPLALPLASG